MTTFTESIHRTGAYIVSCENIGSDNVPLGRVVRDSTKYNGDALSGTLMGKVTATGEFKPCDPTASDGSEVIAGILYRAMRSGVASQRVTIDTRNIVADGHYLIAPEMDVALLPAFLATAPTSIKIVNPELVKRLAIENIPTPLTREELDALIIAGANLEHADVSQITNFNRLFRGNSTFNQDIGGWDVSSGTDFDLMFADNRGTPCVFNQDISSWNMSSAETCQSMFLNNTVFQSDLSNWDMHNVHTMFQMFTNASSFSSDLSSWNIANVTNHDNFSSGAGTVVDPNWAGAPLTRVELEALIVADVQADIESANVSLITNFSSLFLDNTTFNYNISGWDISSALTIDRMFKGATAFNQPLNSWYVSNITDFTSMFNGATSFNQPLNSWNTGSAQNMTRTFKDASSFAQNLAMWNVDDVGAYGSFALGAGALIEPNWV